ncbi:MAG: hypothetical protein QF512_14340 [Alphaproteobacteria bacterium]|nr:hypothetical protein [Alphaproteobacteria bacterium]
MTKLIFALCASGRDVLVAQSSKILFVRLLQTTRESGVSGKFSRNFRVAIGNQRQF